MSAANVDGMVQAAIRAYRGGNKQEAQQLLEKATELDPMHEQAWMWMSAVVDSPADQRVCLENVLYINPNNENARRGIAMLPADKPTPEPQADADPFIEEPPADPSADDYIIPSSSPSATFSPAAQPSSEVYDDWVAGLGLGGSEEASSPVAQSQPASDDAFSGLFGDAFDADDEQSQPDSTTALDTAPFGGTYLYDDDMFGEDDFDDDEDMFGEADSYQSDGPFSSDFDLDLDLDEDAVFTTPARPAPTSKPKSRPSRTSTPASPSSPMDDMKISGGGFYDSQDMGGVGELEPGEYFKRIPKGIKATRVPGTREKLPLPMVAGVAILSLLNIAALLMLVMNLGG